MWSVNDELSGNPLPDFQKKSLNKKCIKVRSDLLSYFKHVKLKIYFHFLYKHIGRNPRFDRKQRWAEIGNIGQTYGTLERHWEDILVFSCNRRLLDSLM